MKAMSQAVAWDRMTTREELTQIIDLLESIPAGRETGRMPAPELPLVLAADQASTRSKDLWLDTAQELEPQSLDSSLESLVEMFAAHNDLIN